MATIELQLPELADIAMRLERLEKAHKTAERPQSETDSPLREPPGWSLMGRDEVAKLTGICPATLGLMIKQGIVPDGVQALGNKKVWTVAQVRDIAERMANGEFTGIRLWAKEAQS